MFHFLYYIDGNENLSLNTDINNLLGAPDKINNIVPMITFFRCSTILWSAK